MDALIFLGSLVALSVLSARFGHESRPGFAPPLFEHRFGWVDTWSLLPRPDNGPNQ